MKGYLIKIRLYLLIFLLFGCSEVSLNDKLLQAEKLYEDKKYSEVIIQTKNIIRDQPQNSQARILIANSYYQLGLFVSAEKEYSNTFELIENTTKIGKNYLLTLYALDDHVGIINYWEQNQASFSALEKAKISYIVSLSYLNQAQAQKSYELANSSKQWATATKKPELIAINSAISDTYKQPANIEDSIKSLNNVCSLYPQQWLVCQLLANALFSTNEYDQASNVYKQILENKPNYNKIAIRLADSYVRAKNTEQATLLITALLDSYPKQPYLNLLAAATYLAKKNYQVALNHINITLNQGMNTPQAKLTASIVHFNLGSNEQALSHLNSLNKDYPDNQLIKRLYIAIQLRLGNGNSISNAYEQYPVTKENSELFALASLELLKSGKNLESTELVKKIDTSLIENQDILNSISIVKLSSGDKSGIKDLEKSLKNLIEANAPEIKVSRVKALLVSSLLAANDFNEANNYVKLWVSKDPSNINNKLLNIAVEKGKQTPDINKIQRLYNSVLEIDNSNFSANLFLGSELLSKGEYKKAVEYIEIAINKDKHSAEAIKSYLIVQEKLSNKKKAITNLTSKYQHHLTDFRERITLAQIYLLTSQEVKAIELLESVKTPKTFNTRKVNAVLAQSYFNIKDYEKAIKTYRNMLTEGYQNKIIIGKLASSYENMNDLDEAIDAFEALHQNYPENIQIGLVLSNFYIFNKKEYAALRYFSTLTNEQQNHPAVMGLKGKALFFAKQYQKSLPLLKQSYKETNNPKLIPFMFDSHVNLNDSEKAFQLMDEYLLLNPDEIDFRFYYAGFLYKTNKNKAAEQYVKILKTDKVNLIALNNLAWILYELGELVEAKKHIDKAIKLFPDNSDVKDTLATINTAIKKQ